MGIDPFATERSKLFAIAYRMLGSASDAEDVLQDAWLRYGRVDPAEIRTPAALAATIVTRLSLDRLKSARAQREEYIGPWLPEPVLTSEIESPSAAAERSESLTLAFLVLLETLSPEERAVFVLKNVFEYEHAEIAGMLGITEVNSRQLLRRAKARVAAARPQARSPIGSARALAERFARAFSSGDAEALTSLLADDVGVWSDGGGKVAAARRPILGRDGVVTFLVGLHRTATRIDVVRDASIVIEDVNGEAALILAIAGRLESVFVMSAAADRIVAIRVVRNPEKLARISRQMGLAPPGAES
jgi:RNA polymerase sigma-70 factor (ECF subfamily)